MAKALNKEREIRARRAEHTTTRRHRRLVNTLRSAVVRREVPRRDAYIFQFLAPGAASTSTGKERLSRRSSPPLKHLCALRERMPLDACPPRDSDDVVA